MPFALIAKINVAPDRVLKDPEVHDFLHILVGARFIALHDKGLSLIPAV